MSGQIRKLAPVLVLLVVLVVSAFVAYVWGAASVSIVNTGLWQLEPSYQGIYVQAVADAYAQDGDSTLAAERLSFICQANDGLNMAFAKAEERYGGDLIKRANLEQLRNLATSGQVSQNASVPVCSTSPVDSFAGIARLAGPVVIILMAVGIVGYGVLQVIRSGEEQSVGVAAPVTASGTAAPAIGRKAPPPPAAETARSAAARGAAISREVEKTDFVSVGMEPPLVQFMTTYLKGDDLYDDSFSIDTPSGEFLGECGVGISETIGTGNGKNVTAFEVWLFDKNDIRTVTKVLMSEHAYGDDAIRARLAPKGEAVLAKAGDKIMLETASLRVQARIVDLSYDDSTPPPKGVISRITIELAAWKSSKASGGGGAATPPGGLPSIGS